MTVCGYNGIQFFQTLFDVWTAEISSIDRNVCIAVNTEPSLLFLLHVVLLHWRDTPIHSASHLDGFPMKYIKVEFYAQ